MIDVVPINTVFKTLLETHTEATFAMQRYNDRPRPNFPYATWDLNSLVSIGHDALLEPNSSGEAEILGDREFVVPIQFYGCNPVTNLEHFETAMRLQSVTAALDAVGVVFVQVVGSITDLTELIDTKFEPRANGDFLFRIGKSIIDTGVGNIEAAQVDAEYKKEDDTTITDTIQIGNIP